MGALTPVLSNPVLLSQGIGLVSQAVGGAVQRSQSQDSQELALAQLQAKQGLQEQQLAADAALKREEIALSQATAEEARKAALKRAVARQRASFGAQGIGSGAGSSQAVLLGMFEESDDERSARERLDNLRLSALDQDVAQAKSLNVLQRTQLAERQKLQTLSTQRSAVSGLFGV